MNKTGLFEADPQRWLRMAGALYLAIIALGLFGEVGVRGSLVVAGDAAATAAAIAASPGLWRWGITTDLLMHVLDVPVMVALYLLLKPVNPGLAMMATVINAVQTTVLATNKMHLVWPLLLLNPLSTAAQMPPADRQTLAYAAIQAHAHGFGIGLIFFGVACLLRGWLIVKSAFMPALLGWLLVAGGLGYLINSTALLLAPAWSDLLFPWVLLPALVAELGLALWLIFKSGKRLAAA